jgi:hypothetical protein
MVAATIASSGAASLATARGFTDSSGSPRTS